MTKAITVPRVPARANHSPVSNTQLQPIMAPQDRASTSRFNNVLENPVVMRALLLIF
jgi:hypothetical protein